MKAIILAAGFSTRLGELTLVTPKGLLEVNGQEIVLQILEQILEQKKAGNIDEIVLVTNNLYFDKFKNWLEKNGFGQDVGLVNNGANSNEERLGAIGDILLVLNQFKWNDDVLVVASDTRTSMKLFEFIQFFNQHKTVVNAVFDTKNVELIRGALGNVELDEHEKITEFLEKPSEPISTITSIPYYIFNSDSLYLIEKYTKTGGSMDSPGSILQWLINQTPVYGFLVEGYYKDIGTPEALKKAGG